VSEHGHSISISEAKYFICTARCRAKADDCGIYRSATSAEALKRVITGIRSM
jgi:hypothetical protein